MSAKRACEECGAELPANAPQGLCPQCLVGMGVRLAPGAERPASDSAGGAAPIVTEKPGERIGRYKLLQKIGEGGMGVVYMAEQEEPIRRRVALKIIKLGMDTRQVVARFEAERQALALMDHPNIAKVLDAGATETGRPYFVMELVRGVPVTEYCDKNHLPTRERLDLFIEVCQAIQHAHQKGVIHRDLKPSNILVTLNDGVPLPMVIDFGVAKATNQKLTEKTLFTNYATIIGTPAYMSPEQAEMSKLDVDTRTDIYALGVLFYELLTGTTPFSSQELLNLGYGEMQRIISEKEPLRPSTRLSTMDNEEQTVVAKNRSLEASALRKLFRGDLDWIVMKCLEKDRRRRYETASGLAMDVQRYLADEPVVARPPSNLYRFQKLVRRNKLAFAAGAAVAMALVVGLAISLWQSIEKSRAYRRSVVAEQAARTEAQKSRQVAQFLKDMLQSVGPSVALGRDTTTLREILDKTANRVGKDLTNQPEVEVELCLTLVATYHDLGLYEKIEGLARQSLQLARAKLGAENESVAASLIWLGDALKHRAQIQLGDMQAGKVEQAEMDRRLYNGNLVEAEKCCREGLAMSRKLLGNDNLNVANALNNLASVLTTQYKLAEAEALQREALAMYRKLLGDEHAKVAKLSYELAVMLAFQYDKQAEAEIMNREALAMQRKLLGNDHPEIAASLFNLAIVLRLQGKQAEAVTKFREVITMWRKLQANDRIELADALSQLAQTLMPQGKLAEVAEAETLQREALAMQRRLFGNEHAEVAISLFSLATMLMQQGRLDEAETMSRESLAMRRKLPGNEHGDLAWSLNGLAYILEKRGKLAEAETMQRETLAIQKKRFGNVHFEVAASLARVADMLQQQGRLDEAEAMYRDALATKKKLPGNEFGVASFLHQLAHALEKQGRVGEAETLYREALATQQKLPDNDYGVAESLETLANALESQGEVAEAEVLVAESVTHKRTLLRPDNSEWAAARDLELARSIHKLGRFQQRAGRLAEAATGFGEALAIRRRILGDENTDVTSSFNRLDAVLATLASRLGDEGKFTQAEPVARERLAINECQSPDHWRTFHARAELGGSLVAQKKLAEAEPLLLSAYEGMKEREFELPTNAIAGPADAAGRLVQLYESNGQVEKAAEWKQRRTLAQAVAQVALEVAARRASGAAHAQHGRFAAAVADFARVIELRPGDHEVWHWQAATLVQSGQLDDYRGLRRKSVQLFGNTTNFHTAERIAKDYLMLPSSEAGLDTAAKMAAMAVSAPTNHSSMPWFRLAKGFAEYRQGQFASAAEWMQKVLSNAGNHLERDVEAYAVLAMAQQQLKQTDEARATFAKGLGIVDAKMPKLDTGDIGPRWIDWIIAHALMREANGLIEGGARSSGETK